MHDVLIYMVCGISALIFVLFIRRNTVNDARNTMRMAELEPTPTCLFTWKTARYAYSVTSIPPNAHDKLTHTCTKRPGHHSIEHVCACGETL